MDNLIERRTFLGMSLGSAGALMLAACTGGDRRPSLSASGRPTLRLPGGEWGFPSPFAYLAGPGYFRMSYIYDTLLWEDATGEPLPWLASRYQPSSDGLTHTFEMRDNVRWQDGRPLTAEDVVFTVNYFAAQSRTLSPLVIARGPRDLVNVTASGRNVEFRLAQPDIAFREAIAAMPIVPRHVWSSVPDASKVDDPTMLVGSGPYRLESYTRGEGSYLYTANDDHFLGEPYVERIENLPVDDALTGLLAGILDSAGSREAGVGSDALAPFRGDDSYGIIEDTGGFTLGLYWNLAKGGPLADVRFRRACIMAIDRQGYVDKVLGGNGAPGNPGFLPPSHPLRVDVEQYPYDPGMANRLLDDAGYPRGSSGIRQDQGGRPLRYTMLVLNTLPPIVDVVARSLKEVGVELVVQALDIPSQFGRMTRGDYEMAIPLYGGLSGDPDYMRALYSSKSPVNFQHAQGYVDPEFDAIAERQRRTLDAEERKKLVARMQQIVARDVPFLPLFYPAGFQVFKKSVFDQWYYTPGGFAGGNPYAYNKQAYVTGRKTGLDVRTPS